MIRGTIHRRLLVNAVVDPDEAARRLPVGLRPHVTALGTVVGCCLLEIDRIRPAFLPAPALSPNRHGVLEGACMEPDHRRVREVKIDDLDSVFLSSFKTAQLAPSYLMADVGVTWTPAAVPTFAGAGVPA